MKIAEFFILIGLKGDDKSAKSLKKLDDGIKDIKQNTILAKAAVLALFYELQKLTTDSANFGMKMQNFSDYTGMDPEILQRWQAFFRMGQVGSEEVTQSMVKLQGMMTKIFTTGEAPEGFDLFQRTIGLDLEKAYSDSAYTMDKIREYLKTEKDKNFANQVVGSLGISPDMIARMRVSNMDIMKIPKNLISSSGEIGQLANVSEQWSKFGLEFDAVMRKLTASYGLEGVKTVRDAFRAVIEAGQEIGKITKEIPALQDAMVTAGIAIAAAWAPITATVGGVVFLLSQYQKNKEGKETFLFGKGQMEGGLFGRNKQEQQSYEKWKDIFSGGFNNFQDLKQLLTPDGKNGNLKGEEVIAPNMNPHSRDGASNNFQINQQLYIQGNVEDQQEVAGLHEEAAEFAYRQSFAQGMVT